MGSLSSFRNTRISRIINIVELLLKHGADPNIKEKAGRTVLSFICSASTSQEQIEIVELLLKHKADPNIMTEHKRTPLLVASIRGNNELVELLLKHKADPNLADQSDWTPLMYTCDLGDYETSELLLKAGADPNFKCDYGDTTALGIATSRGHKQQVELLRKYGAKE